jgi:hypothetical protein
VRIPHGWLPQPAAAIVIFRRLLLVDAVGRLIRRLFVLDAVWVIGRRRSRGFLHAEPGRLAIVFSGPQQFVRRAKRLEHAAAVRRQQLGRVAGILGRVAGITGRRSVQRR